MRSSLKNLLFDDRGHPMRPVFTTKKTGQQRYRYYVSAALKDPDARAGSLSRLPAEATERIVRDQVSPLKPTREAGFEWSDIRLAVRRVTASADCLEVLLDPERVRDQCFAVEPTSIWLRERDDGLALTIPLTIGRSASGETLIRLPTAPYPSKPDDTLVKALARGWRWRRLLETGAARSFGELGRQEGLSERYIAKPVNLALLSPALITAIVEGKMPPGLDLAALMRSQIPLCWDAQKAFLQQLAGRSETGRPREAARSAP